MPEFHDRRDGSVHRLPEDAIAREAAFNEAQAAWVEKQRASFDSKTKELRESADRPEETRPISEQKAAAAQPEESDEDFMRRYEAEMQGHSDHAEEIRPVSEQKRGK